MCKMFGRGVIRKVVQSAKLKAQDTERILRIKARSVQMSNAPTVQRFFSFDLTSTYVHNVVCCRLYTQAANPEPVIDYQYVKKATKDPNVLLVDVREPDEVKEHGKIPNSINIPLGNVTSVLSSMTEKEFQQTYKRSKPNTSTDIIFYCMIGKRSGNAQQNAIDLGYKNAKNYLGSWTDWINKEQ